MAVYTPLNQQDIEAFLAQYDIGELVSFEGIAEGIENTNYLVILSAAKDPYAGGDPSATLRSAQGWRA